MGIFLSGISFEKEKLPTFRFIYLRNFLFHQFIDDIKSESQQKWYII